MAKGKSVLSTGEVAKICHVSPRTVQKWFDTKLINGYLIPGGRDRRIPREELIRFMQTNNIPMPKALLTPPRAMA
jgi:excisionase family DNA binding protein